ncbi:MAG: MogA/MoaB family molybdenum cofactor biosynthesis protein [Planctomycetes bacterium]|nr:MogA/MoaB family molybdenum cofactor biosynthesis protein [Planctomycetota bacterium]
MPDPIAEHRAAAPRRIRCAVITVSDTRTEATDRGGPLVVEMLAAAGHDVIERMIVPDEPQAMRDKLSALTARDDVDAVLLTGGTGISPRDQTFETLSALITKPLPGYGELFRMLSFQEIGAAAMLSRAVAGLIGQTIVFSMPGSPAAVRLAMERLILPELGHLTSQARAT